MNCPHCGKEINVGALIGSVSTPAKTRSSRANGKLGGRPKKPSCRVPGGQLLTQKITRA